MAGKELGIRLGGSGGQGVILCSVILAKAELAGGGYAAQSQSYGPAARGGACKAEVVHSDKPIDFPKVEESDFLLALTQSALEKYLPQAKAGSVVMIDSGLTMPAGAEGFTVYSLPILDTAAEKLKKPMVANIVACGAINACLGLSDRETLEAAVLDSVPKGTEELNRSALSEGVALWEAAKKA